MFAKTIFGELVNLGQAREIFARPGVAGDACAWQVWACFSEDALVVLHEGTQEECQGAMDEIFLRLNMSKLAFGILAKSTKRQLADYVEEGSDGREAE